MTIWLPLLAAAAVLTACGVLDGSPSPTATRDANQSLGLEIAETYGQLLLQTRLVVEPRPAAADVKEGLRVLAEEYKVLFANYGCLLETLSSVDQAAVAAAFDANRERFLPADMTWFEDAAGDYDLEDVVIRERFEDIATLDDYAFLDRVAASRPGEEVRCG